MNLLKSLFAISCFLILFSCNNDDDEDSSPDNDNGGNSNTVNNCDNTILGEWYGSKVYIIAQNSGDTVMNYANSPYYNFSEGDSLKTFSSVSGDTIKFAWQCTGDSLNAENDSRSLKRLIYKLSDQKLILDSDPNTYGEDTISRQVLVSNSPQVQ